MSLATLQEFYDRVDTDVTFQLTLKAQVSVPPTDDELAQRDTKSQAALDDASAKLLAYRPRIASDYWPDADAQRADCVRVALYMLAGVKGFGEFKQIQDGYDAVIASYEKLAEESADVGVTANAPRPVFNRHSLKGL